jgi:hypothetical protein
MLKLTQSSFCNTFKDNELAGDVIFDEAKFVFYTIDYKSRHIFWGWGKTKNEAISEVSKYLEENNPYKITYEQLLLLEIIPDDEEEVTQYKQETIVEITSDKPIPPGLKISIHLNF